MDDQNIEHITTEIKNILGSLSFPVGKDDVVQWAQQHNVSDEITDVLKKLPPEQFGNLEEVVRKLPLHEIEEDIRKIL